MYCSLKTSVDYTSQCAAQQVTNAAFTYHPKTDGKFVFGTCLQSASLDHVLANLKGIGIKGMSAQHLL